MYSATPKLGRKRLLDRPTTAMVCADRSSSATFGIRFHSGAPRRFSFRRTRSAGCSRCLGAAALRGLSQTLDFLEVEISILSRLQGPLLDRSDPHPLELLDQPAEMFEHKPDLILSPFDNPHFIPGILGAVVEREARGSRAAAFERNAVAKGLFLLCGQRTVHFDQISLGQVACGGCDGVEI